MLAILRRVIWLTAALLGAGWYWCRKTKFAHNIEPQG